MPKNMDMLKQAMLASDLQLSDVSDDPEVVDQDPMTEKRVQFAKQQDSTSSRKRKPSKSVRRQNKFCPITSSQSRKPPSLKTTPTLNSNDPISTAMDPPIFLPNTSLHISTIAPNPDPFPITLTSPSVISTSIAALPSIPPTLQWLELTTEIYRDHLVPYLTSEPNGATSLRNSIMLRCGPPSLAAALDHKLPDGPLHTNPIIVNKVINELLRELGFVFLPDSSQPILSLLTSSSV